MTPSKSKRPKPPNAGKGRPKGSVNKSTAQAREAIARFVDNNADRLQEWLDRIANGTPADPKAGTKAVPGDPEKAFQLFQSVIEYHVPKLARTEHMGEGGGPVRAEVAVRFV